MAIDNVNNDFLNSISADRLQTGNKKTELGQQDFLKLMTAQLNNQDPLKPMQNGEFFNQIAQFSAVSGINGLQQSFTQVADAMFSSQALQASGMVGRMVMIGSNQMIYNQGQNVAGSVDLPSGTDKLFVDVYDANGELVKRTDYGNQAGGTFNFTWDGMNEKGEQMPSGTYYVKAEANYGNKNVTLDTYMSRRVDSVSIGSQGTGISLNLSDGQKASLSEIKQIS